jgi:hypothetical protein
MLFGPAHSPSGVLHLLWLSPPKFRCSPQGIPHTLLNQTVLLLISRHQAAIWTRRAPALAASFEWLQALCLSCTRKVCTLW